MSRHLDCCDAPSTTLIEAFLEESHRHERLVICRCGQRWFDRFHEDVDWRDGDDEMYSWLTPLTESQAARILAGERELLGGLRTIYIDAQNRVHTISGAPIQAWPPR
jgi:phage terminase large subunit GpA-like protein